MNIVAQTTPLDQIVANANNAALRPGTTRVIFANEIGKLVLIADRRCQLKLQIFPAKMPVAHPMAFTLALYDMQTQTWQLKADIAAAEAWMVEARAFFGIEAPTPEPDALPDPIDPVEAAADSILAENAGDAGDAFRKRLASAVELVRASITNFPHYQTSFEPSGFYGVRSCQCGDAQYRSLYAPRIGTVCKHTLAMLLSERIRQQRDAVAQRKLASDLDRNRRTAHEIARETALPANASDNRRLEDALGYDDLAEKPWYLRPDPINRSRAGAGRAQFRVRYGSN